MRSLILACVVISGGCMSTGGNGVYKRISSSVPSGSTAIAPSEPPRAFDVRVGASGGSTPAKTTEPATAHEGERTSSALDGDAYVGLGMPGSGETAGWELVGGASFRDGAHGGFGQINAAAGNDTATRLAVSFAVRAMQIPFTWDYGGCIGPECTMWNPKGPTSTGNALGWGASGSLQMWRRLDSHVSFLLAVGFDVAPSIATSAKDEVQCDGNGNCAGGRHPSTPETEMGEPQRQVVVGVDGMLSFARVYGLVTYSDAFDEVAQTGPNFQARVGVETRFR